MRRINPRGPAAGYPISQPPVKLEARINDPHKIWKLSPMDLKSYSRWYEYSRARDDMFKATDTPWAPWHVIRSDDKKRTRLNTIAHLLSQVPYEEAPRETPVLPSGRSRRVTWTPTIRTSSCPNSNGEKGERRDILTRAPPEHFAFRRTFSCKNCGHVLSFTKHFSILGRRDRGVDSLTTKAGGPGNGAAKA